MKHFLILCSAAALLTGCSADQDEMKYAKWVDPFIGTDGIVHTFPGATTPFGMIQLSPDTDTQGWNWCSGYHTSDSSIKGFSHNHLSGTGWSDLGDILVMATVGEVKTEPGSKENPDEGYRSRIDHARESAQAGYYQVELLDYGINAEMTATPRVGFHRYTFPETQQANIIIDPTNKIFGEVIETHTQVVDDNTIQGWCLSNGWGGKRKVFFTADFSKDFETSSDGPKAWAQFSTSEGESITVKVALSYVSQQGAQANMAAEGLGRSFEGVRQEALHHWNKKLSQYQFEGVSDDQMKILYTGLYHMMIQPNLNQDVDGQYMANGSLERAAGYTNYSTFSFWDTFRAVHPLLTITDHRITREITNSLASRFAKGGHLPLWELLGYDNACMIGYPAVAVMADAILKDVKGIDPRVAYAAMRNAAFYDNHSSSDGPSGINEYIRLGYVPSNIASNVSKTAEYSYYDWCIARVAEKLGKTADAELFDARSMNFMNLYRPDKKMLYPKDTRGRWVDLSLTSWESLRPHYVSGNIWAYSYFYPHAIDRVIEAMGGAAAFEASMDSILSTPLVMQGEQHVDISGFIGQYGHGDEPGHQFIYLYNKVGAAWKIADYVNKISSEYYNATRNGMPNNDDCGQMSAWYIFSAMGFYPVCPGDLQYVIGAPMLPGATIITATGNTFRMVAKNFNAQNKYVESVMLNGAPLTRGYVTHQEIMDGATLEFTMSATPNKNLFR